MGFLDADPTLTADELYEWIKDLVAECFFEQQPVTYGPETVDRALRSLVDTRDPKGVLARLSVPQELALSSRVTLGISAIIGALHATLPARAIADDIDEAAPPVTELGKAHHAWVKSRGLPAGLDPR